MRSTNSLSILAVAGSVLFLVGFACNSGSDSSTTSNSTTTTSNSTPASSASKNIAGNYDATGKNPNGAPYKASLVVTPHDDVYQFTWTSGKASYDGVGVMTDDEVAVSFTNGENGKGCGVVLYTINKDGSLDGKAGYWGTNTMETEHGTKKKADADLDGVYDITGKSPEGKTYKGTLTVIQSGEGYTFDWDTGSTLSGYGIKAGNYVAVGFGGKQCSFVGYDVKPDGTLDGKWGSQFARKLGTEIAKKK